MKNQYFGDINDYKKYGLLRSVIGATKFRVLVAWMLTPDDGGTDGKFTGYLHRPNEYAHHDPELFQGLVDLITLEQRREVRLIEDAGLLSGAEYFSETTPDSGAARNEWFDTLLDGARDADLVFLDPDNGLEVKSRPYGCVQSSKYLYWREVDALWSAGKSLLIYQHFIREKRSEFTPRMLEALKAITPGSLVAAFSTVNVVFLMALQPEHHDKHGAIVDVIQRRWKDRIKHRGFVEESLEENVDTFTIDQVLDALNRHKIRATYSAVAPLLRTRAMSLAGQFLGRRRPHASWVVSKQSGMPSGYSQKDCHPDLLSKTHVIEDPAELINLIRGG